MPGILLILYVLVISGLVAVVGDRVGYRIGKKRLSWFNLRPRHTAILVAILTGMMISGLTLGSLLLLNQSLANVLFNYNQIIAFNQLYADAVRQDAERRIADSQRTLDEAQTQRGDAQKRLADLKQQIDDLTLQQQQTREALTQANQRLATIQAQFAQAQQDLARAQQQYDTIQGEAEAARQQVKKLQQQQVALNKAKITLEESNQRLQLDRAQLERSLLASQSTLETLSQQKGQLEAEIGQLGQTASRLRRGELAIFSGEVLSSGVISTDPGQPQKQLDALLAKAEDRAQQLGARPDPTLQTAVQIRQEDVISTLKQISQPGSWVVRIRSLSNRLLGETVPVEVEVKPNRLLFSSGSVLASATILPGQDGNTLQQQLLNLLSQANQRSQDAGLLSNPITGTVGEFSQVKLLEMVQQLQQIKTPTSVSVVTDTEIYSAGPLVVSFWIQNRLGASSQSRTPDAPHL